jgi:UDP-N-acetylmuramyl pentapeptide phosphotransferase/UDP-N-acetylglucosamine-1-phosphate transferase
MSNGGRLITAAVGGFAAAGAARYTYTLLKRTPPGGDKHWSRKNHRGEPVTLLEGPAVAAGAVLAALGTHPAIAVAGVGAAAFGTYDDLSGSGDRRGFRGHVGALMQGEVTTGMVKLGGIGATGLVSSVLASNGSAADVVINVGLVAGGANLLNLFDLRPGRAIKVALGSSALIAAGGALAGNGASSAECVAPAAGAAVALLPDDLGERAMLGDGGANALGAMLGAAAAVSLPRPARLALLAGIAGLTAASEKVSFTKVIAATPALHWLDMLGRRPVAPAQAPIVKIPVPAQPEE